jgi:hypothetical protein
MSLQLIYKRLKLINIPITEQVFAGQVGLFYFPTKQHQACAFVDKETPQIVSNMTEDMEQLHKLNKHH